MTSFSFEEDALTAMPPITSVAEGEASAFGDVPLERLESGITEFGRPEVLAGDTEGRCELEDGPVPAAETARRLGCDAAVVDIVEDERGTPLDVGRKTALHPTCNPSRPRGWLHRRSHRRTRGPPALPPS